MKHRWYVIGLKIAMITTLLFSLGEIITPKTAFACSGSNGDGITLCMTTSGSGVRLVQPHLTCSNGGATPNFNNIMSGCNGGNAERRGIANNGLVSQWVERYGWTYNGTGDGLRYYTFSNYTYFAPMDTALYAIPYSDGSDNTCTAGTLCDYQAWNNYIADWHSPTAQLRDWAIGSPRVDLNEYPLSSPQPGHCQGTQSGQQTDSFNAGITVGGAGQSATIGYSTQGVYTYYSDGECNDGTNVDSHSIFMNLNWSGGAYSRLCFCTVNADTDSAQSFVNVTAFVGPNGANNGHFVQGWNLNVSYWSLIANATDNYNLQGDGFFGPNYSYNIDDWH